MSSNRGLSVRFVMVLYMAMAAASLLLGHFVAGRNIFTHHEGWFGLVGMVSLGAGSGLAVVVICRVMVKRFRSWYRLNLRFRQLLGELSGRDVLFIAFASSFGEELLFRGLIQPELGLIATSLIFGLLHIGTEKIFIGWTAMAVIMGFLLGGLFELTGNLLAPLLTHFTVNYFNLLALYDAPRLDDGS